MKILAKDGSWNVSFWYLWKGKEKYQVDLPSLAEFLGLFPEELLAMVKEGKEVHLESLELGKYVGA